MKKTVQIVMALILIVSGLSVCFLFYLKFQQINGAIAAARGIEGKHQIVMITVENSRIIKNNTVFNIYRNGRYIASAQVKDRYPNIVACIIDQTTLNTDSIHIGDEAVTALFQWPLVY